MGGIFVCCCIFCFYDTDYSYLRDAFPSELSLHWGSICTSNLSPSPKSHHHPPSASFTLACLTSCFYHHGSLTILLPITLFKGHSVLLFNCCLQAEGSQHRLLILIHLRYICFLLNIFIQYFPRQYKMSCLLQITSSSHLLSLE